MKYKYFMSKLCVVDALLDSVENKDDVEVTCNKISNIPVLIFKNGEKIIDCIVLKGDE